MQLVLRLGGMCDRCYPPFISLDVAWCHNGGYAMGGYTEWMYTSC